MASAIFTLLVLAMGAASLALYLYFFVPDPEPEANLKDGNTELKADDYKDGYRLVGDGVLADVYRVNYKDPDERPLHTWEAVEGLRSYKITDNPKYSEAIKRAKDDEAFVKTSLRDEVRRASS